MTTISKNDQRPIDVALLKQLLRHSLKMADATIADDSSIIACDHPNVDDDYRNFCNRCGALVVPVGAALESLAPTLGVAFALQQVLRGEAIALEQRR